MNRFSALHISKLEANFLPSICNIKLPKESIFLFAFVFFGFFLLCRFVSLPVCMCVAACCIRWMCRHSMEFDFFSSLPHFRIFAFVSAHFFHTFRLYGIFSCVCPPLTLQPVPHNRIIPNWIFWKWITWNYFRSGFIFNHSFDRIMSSYWRRVLSKVLLTNKRLPRMYQGEKRKSWM